MTVPDRRLSLRLHGRGGQGVVTAAELLSVAAFLDGRYAQAFPSFGSERMGAPVMSFCRVSNRPIRTREPVSAPDVVVIVDVTLLHHVDVFAGLASNGCAVINSSRDPAELGLAALFAAHPDRRLVTVAATDLARAHIGRPLPNVCLLGSLAAATGVVTLPALERAVRERFAEPVANANIAAARAAFDITAEPAHA